MIREADGKWVIKMTETLLKINSCIPFSRRERAESFRLSDIFESLTLSFLKQSLHFEIDNQRFPYGNEVGKFL